MKKLLYFVILVCPLIFFTDLTRNPYVIQGTILYISLLLILGLFIIRSLREGKIVYFRTRLDLPLLVFLGFTIFTFLRALLGSYNIPGFGAIPGFSDAAWSEGSRTNLFILINCVLVFYVAVNFIRDEETIKRVLFLSFLVAFIASIYAILQYFDLEPIWQQTVSPYSMKRPVSTFGNPVFLSSFLVIMIPLSIVSFIWAKSGFERFLHICLTAIMVLALFMTMARSSWIGLLVSVVFLAIIFKQKIAAYKKWIFIAAAIVLLFMLIPTKWQNESKPFGFYVAERATSIFSFEKSGPAVYQRFLIWLSAWDISKQNPVIGAGWGLFEMLYPFYQQRWLTHPLLTQRTHANNAHNVVLENLSQMGIVGLGVFLWLIFCILKFGIHQIKNVKNDFHRMVAAGIFAGIIGMLVDNIVNVTLYFIIPGFFFWMFLGVLAGIGTSEKKVVKHSLISKTVFVVVILISALLVKMYASIFFAEINYFDGFKLAKKPETPIEQAVPYLERAHQLHRLEVNNNYELGNAYARIAAQYRYMNAPAQADEYQKKTIWAYQEAIAANPGYDEIYFNIATVYMQRNELAQAEENYKRAIFINPFSLDAMMGLGNIYLFSQQFEPAKSLYQRAAFVNPASKDAWNNLGFADMKLNLLAEARECFLKALAIDPNFDIAKRNLSNIRAVPNTKK